MVEPASASVVIGKAQAKKVPIVFFNREPDAAVTLSGDGEEVTVQVADHGPGIPAEAREEVFARFHSLRPEGEDFGGHSGLGLAIARTIVEAQDGTLVATDRPDGKPGACLVARFPAWRDDAA